MKRIAAAVLLLLMLAGTALGEELTLTDAQGETVTLHGRPERTAVLFSSLADIWLSAGGKVAVTVGESVERGFADADTPLVDGGAGKSIDLEALLAEKPDLVLCSADVPAQAEAARLLNAAGIPALALRVESFGDYLEALEMLTRVTGDETAYEENGAAVQARVEELLASEKARTAAGKTMLFVRAGSTDRSTKAKTADEHFACAMLEELGCVNIASDAPLLSDTLSMEAILEADPDFIFISLMGDEAAARTHVEDMLSQKTWSALSAVRNGRAVILPRELFHFKPNARWDEAYAYLIDVLNGEKP